MSGLQRVLSGRESVLDSIKDREYAYLLSGTRIRIRSNVAGQDVGSIHLESMNQGDVVELPRWIAEILIDLGLAESQEETFASEVFKAVNREKMAGDNQIASLRPDFYLKTRRHLASNAQELQQHLQQGGAAVKPASVVAETERTRTLIYDLVALRLRKILLISSALSPPPDIKAKLTPEEYQIFDSVYRLLQSWRRAVTEGSTA